MLAPFRSARILVFCCLGLPVIHVAAAAEPATTCQASGWDMSRELKAFGRPPQGEAAGSSASNMPLLKLDTLYALRLRAQSEVEFVQPPIKAGSGPTPMGGVTRFKVSSRGVYRVTLDSPLWIDVVTATGIIPPSAYTGWHECTIFRKSVDYTLEAGQTVALQFSGAATDLVKVTIVAPPAR
jgi:hypothetical protein